MLRKQVDGLHVDLEPESDLVKRPVRRRLRELCWSANIKFT